MIAVIGDTHIGGSLYGYDLTLAIRVVMYRFLKFCIRHRVKVAVHVGDLFDRPRPTLEHVKLATQWCNEFERRGITLYLLAGNHDVIAARRGGAVTALDSLRSINYQHVIVVDRPRSVLMRDGKAPWTALFLPFPSPTLYEDAQDAARGMIDEMKATEPDPVVVFAHLNVDGAKLGTQEHVYRGGDYGLPLGLDAHERVLAVIDGHIHTAQQLGCVVLIGAAQRRTLGDSKSPIRFLLMREPGDIREYDQTDAAIQMHNVVLDVSGRAHKGTPPGTEQVLMELVAGMPQGVEVMKVSAFVDESSAVDWGTIEEKLYRVPGMQKVIIPPPVHIQRKAAQVVQPMAIGEPLKAARFFIKSRVKDAAEQVALVDEFRKLQQEVGDGSQAAQ